jgi:hypothetical protein
LVAVDITRDEDAKMAYTWYEEDIVQRYGVVVDGWVGPFINPSTMSTSLVNLRALAQAWKSGECRFRKLTAAEAAARKAKWDEDVAAGLVTAKHRAERSDKGSSRKTAHADSSSRSRKRARDEEDTQSDDTDNDAAPPPDNNTTVPPKKRARKAKESTTTDTAAPKKSVRKAASTAAPKARAAPPKAPRKKTTVLALRDDAITQAARQRLANAGRIKSRAVITSEDEQEEDPHANNMAAGPSSADTAAA